MIQELSCFKCLASGLTEGCHKAWFSSWLTWDTWFAIFYALCFQVFVILS